MEELLKAIKAALEAEGSFASVFLTPLIGEDSVSFPSHMRLPAAAITLGSEPETEDGTAGSLTRRYEVVLAVYAETGLDTDPAQGFIEALQLADTAFTTLHRNLLNLAGFTLAHYNGAGGSSVVEFPGAGVATQIIQRFRYELEE
ncbi:MAG: hypothetical protein ABIK12_00325 [Pseudomonadota bacterium]